MASKQQFNEDDAMNEILQRAMRKDQIEGQALRERLLMAGTELGLSPESIIKAEEEYREERIRTEELSAFSAEQKKVFYMHFGIFIAVMVFLFCVNMLNWSKDKELWVIYPLLGWGIGVVAHALGSLGKVSWHSDEFQAWRRKRLATETKEQT